MPKVPEIIYFCIISRQARGMKLIFLSADKQERFLQVYSNTMGMQWPGISKVPEISLQYLFNVSRKTGKMKLIFCQQINIKGFFKLILSFQVCMARHT